MKAIEQKTALCRIPTKNRLRNETSNDKKKENEKKRMSAIRDTASENKAGSNRSKTARIHNKASKYPVKLLYRTMITYMKL